MTFTRNMSKTIRFKLKNGKRYTMQILNSFLKTQCRCCYVNIKQIKCRDRKHYWRQKRSFHNEKGTIGQDDINIFNLYNPNNTLSKFLKQKFAKQQAHKNKYIKDLNKIKKIDLNKGLM